jgi:hypothetical protein
MELFTVAVVAHLLDPFRALVTFAGVLLWRSPWVVLIAAGISAVVCETLLTTVNFIDDFTYEWGDGFGPGLIACLAQAAVLYLLVVLVRHRRKVGQTVSKNPLAMRKRVSSPQESPLVFGRPEPAE